MIPIVLLGMGKIVLFICCLSLKASAQDAFFSLPASATAYLNPSLVEHRSNAKFEAAWRLQWHKLDGGYSQYYTEYSHYIRVLRGYVSVFGLYENNYVISRQNYCINYTYALRLSRKIIIKPSLGFGYFVKKN